MRNQKNNIKDFHFLTKQCSSLSLEEMDLCSKLFSQNYGIYSSKHPQEEKRNKQIKLGKTYYQKLAQKNDNYVALAYYKDILIGQAFYVVENTTEGNMTWVIQLVVDKKYRRQQVAKKLLFSIWGFSNDRAWGLATTNPVTIKTLESATLRKVSLPAMNKNIGLIKQLARKVSFVHEDSIFISDSNSVVNSTFYVNHDDIPSLIQAYGDDWIFGDLNEGYEWLAFVFSGQELTELSEKEFDKIIEHSEKCLIEAYSRMEMTIQPWTKHTVDEVDFIEKFIPSKDCVIIDVGCGIGRHVGELYKRGYQNIYGYDFSSNLISIAKKNNSDIESHFFVSDCRKMKNVPKADVVLCLYDVIGSFAEQKENEKIVNQIKKHCKKNGIVITSVMNMELTENIAKNKFDVYKNPKKLFKLKASDIMQKSGNIFNPDYFILDTATRVIFRKEMFKGDGLLDSEYIVRDRRYTYEEIKRMFSQFTVLDYRFVQTGHWDTKLKNTDLKAKEILTVLKK